MAEATPSYEQSIASLREQLDQDGHLTENAVSLIVHQAAAARDLFENPIDATFGLIDAMAGGRSKIPQKIVDRLITLSQVLKNDHLAQDANNAGIYSSANQRRELEKAYKEGFSALREVALKMNPPTKPGERPVSLAARIPSSPQK